MAKNKWRYVAVAALTVGVVTTPDSRLRADGPVVHPAQSLPATPVNSPPPSFEPNHGQFDPEVRFVSRARGYTLFLTDREAVIALRSYDAAGAAPSSSSSSVIRLAFDNADAREAIGAEPQPGTVNYLIGNDPAKWHTGISTFASVKYEAVYPGIDLVYYSRSGRHEYDLVVSPGADPSSIGLRITGADLSLDPMGNLLLATAQGPLTLAAPHVYQREEGNTRVIAAHYSTDRQDGVIGFDLGPYDRSLPLVIDPQIVYGTFFGGSGDGVDSLAAIDLDATGAPYIVGSSDNVDFPTASPIQPRRSLSEAVVTKLSPDGRMIYSTYIGGSFYDYGQDIAVRADGTAYVLGSTNSTDFPAPGGFQREFRGGSDSFVLELNKEGTAITRGTLLGGGGADDPGGLALAYPADPAPGEDPASRVFGDWLFVYGSTTSPDFPTVRPVQANRAGARDGFITVFDRQTLEPGFSSYVGQEGENNARTLVLNRARGDAYLWLYRSDDVGPLLAHLKPAAQPAGTVSRPMVAFQNFAAGYAIAQFLKGAPPALLNYYLQVAKTAEANACTPEEKAATHEIVVVCKAAQYFSAARVGARTQAADGLESAVFTVVTAGCLPVAPATTCTERAALVFYDADLNVITHVNFGGTRVGRDFTPSRMVADSSGRFHFVGTTSDRNLPVVSPVQPSYAGGNEGFILTLDPRTGETTFLSYLGGGSGEAVTDIAIDKDGNRWVIGTTTSTDFPATRSGAQPGLVGRIDGFVVKIAP